MSNHKISQQTFDETLLENQDLFDLAPSDAIQETISQFKQQGIQNLSSYILISHPDSKEGKEERETRSVFEGYLDVLDKCVLQDGTVDPDVISSVSGSERGKKVMDALDGVWNFCNLGTNGNSEHDNGSGSSTASTATATATAPAAGNDKKGDKYEKSMAFLTLIHSTNSLFTFMSLLGVVSVDNANDANDDNNNDDNNDNDNSVPPVPPTKEQINIFNKVVQLMISILSPRTASEREIKSLIKDKFVAMERLLLLISLFTALTEQEQENEQEERDCANTLKGLVALATAACRYSERNKVAFVRAFKNSNQNKKKLSTIALLVKGLTVSHLASSNKSKENTNTNPNTNTNTQVDVQLMTEFCKLITILCRYDDFRPEGSAGGLGVGSSNGMNVSSSHDHVLEFNRGGVVPVLYGITIMALTKNNGNKNDKDGELKLVAEDDIVSLASAAMSATRVLAVNDEIVQALVAVGILQVVKLALEMGVKQVADIDSATGTRTADAATTGRKNKERKQKEDRIKVHRQNLTSGAIGLIRNLCGNDGIKTSLCLGAPNNPASSSLHSVLEGMRLYRDNALIQEHGCGALAAMALRKPVNAMRIVHENGPREIVSAMGKFPNNVLVQRQGALAIRNIVSRLVINASTPTEDADNDAAAAAAAESATTDKETDTTTEPEAINVRDVFLDLGAEVVLRHITGRHQGSVDEAYAALRDLGCEVSMSKFDEATQTFSRKIEMFGEVKSNFRPVYEDGDDDLQEKVDAIGIR
jgi:hypothetical protein